MLFQRFGLIAGILAMTGCAETSNDPVQPPSIQANLSQPQGWTEIIGPSSIDYQGTFSWTAQTHNYQNNRPLGQGVSYSWTISTDGGTNWTVVRECGVPALTCGLSDTYSRTISSGHSSFILAVTAVDSSNISGDQVTVTVANPLYPQLTGSISGPTWIDTEGNYTWEAMPSGGSGSYSYQWYARYPEIGTGGWSSMGSSKTQSLYVSGSDGDVEMRVDITSAGQSKTVSVYVGNSSGCPGGVEIC